MWTVHLLSYPLVIRGRYTPELPWIYSRSFLELWTGQLEPWIGAPRICFSRNCQKMAELRIWFSDLRFRQRIGGGSVRDMVPPPRSFWGLFGGGKPVPATMVYTLMFRHNAQDNLVCLSVYKTNRNTHFLVCSELISQQTIRRSVKWSLSMNFLVCTSICLLWN